MLQYSSYCSCYRKNSKIRDTSNNCHNCPKSRKVWYIHCINASKRCWWNGKQRRPWSDCFFRSSLILVCTVCWDISVPIYRICTVKMEHIRHKFERQKEQNTTKLKPHTYGQRTSDSSNVKGGGGIKMGIFLHTCIQPSSSFVWYVIQYVNFIVLSRLRAESPIFCDTEVDGLIRGGDILNTFLNRYKNALDLQLFSHTHTSRMMSKVIT